MEFKFAEDELWPIYVIDPGPHRNTYTSNAPEDLIQEYKKAYDIFMDVHMRLMDVVDSV